MNHKTRPDPSSPNGKANTWDHSSHNEFYDYYSRESISSDTLRRLSNIRDTVLRVARQKGAVAETLNIADVGCGAGTLSMLCAAKGHNVFGVDINTELISLADKRATKAGMKIDFRVGSATELPWPEDSIDVCLVPELLEHVQNWDSCLDEFTRVLKRKGILFLTTSNKLCPVQQEFNLPLYSWYPRFVKRYYEKLAVSTRPDLANYAKYPAVHWFTYYGLRKELARRGFTSMDRFDVMNLENSGLIKKLIVKTIKIIPVIRWLAHVCTPYTLVVARKSAEVT